MNSVSLSRKAYKRIGAKKGSDRVKYRSVEARKSLKRQIRDRDKEPTEKQINKYNQTNGHVITPKEEFKWGIFSKNGYRPLNWYGRIMLFKTEEEAKKMLEEINSKGNAYVIREILEW